MFTVIAPLNAPPQTRRAHTKSRTGCLTCKARRLKVGNFRPLQTKETDHGNSAMRSNHYVEVASVILSIF